jgi:PTS system N-acetylgalactosamine-specific IID component
MVVGTGVYKNTDEAYPLDKKTLGKVALRSLLGAGAKNAETSESIGWAWSLMPALKKIHTDEEDLSLAMGHHLEYVNAAGPFATFAMGVVLALEQQKAEPETIRSVRTALASACDGLGLSMFRYLLVPFIAAICCALAANGNMAGVFVMILACALVSIACRMILINIGYAKGVRAAESFMKHAEELKHASRLAGVFMLGAITVIVASQLNLSASFTTDAGVIELNHLLAYTLPGFAGLAAVAAAYHLLAKKNRSLAFTLIVFVLAALILVMLGFAGDYASPLALPWVYRG